MYVGYFFGHTVVTVLCLPPVAMFVSQGCFPPPCGPESLCTLLDEESVMKLCRGPACDDLRFQYFIIDGTTVIGLLEKPVTQGSG